MRNENVSRSDDKKIILTSANSLAVKEKIERVSKILMERNKKAYKVLSNK
ncbi:MAG: hypothetical protein IKZ58_08870 [Selenomonadaceae bacterium]|nr:hypothetical protein [Selenomonadaceae bacterium]